VVRGPVQELINKARSVRPLGPELQNVLGVFEMKGNKGALFCFLSGLVRVLWCAVGGLLEAH
jgi:hypothetical protein